MLPIRAEAHIDLRPLDALLDRPLQRRPGVLGRLPQHAAVRHHLHSPRRVKGLEEGKVLTRQRR